MGIRLVTAGIDVFFKKTNNFVASLDSCISFFAEVSEIVIEVVVAKGPAVSYLCEVINITFKSIGAFASIAFAALDFTEAISEKCKDLKSCVKEGEKSTDAVVKRALGSLVEFFIMLPSLGGKICYVGELVQKKAEPGFDMAVVDASADFVGDLACTCHCVAALYNWQPPASAIIITADVIKGAAILLMEASYTAVGGLHIYVAAHEEGNAAA